MKRLLLGLSAILCVIASYADTETVKWYVDGAVYDTTTCTSGGNVSLPAEPTKRGHTFNGWVVALHDFSTLDYTKTGTSYSDNASSGTWATGFSYGTVNGETLCSVTLGSFAVAGTPNESTDDGQYCWCKADGYIPDGSNITYEPTASLPWVFAFDHGSASACASGCVYRCAFSARIDASFRRSLFGGQ